MQEGLNDITFDILIKEMNESGKPGWAYRLSKLKNTYEPASTELLPFDLEKAKAGNKVVTAERFPVEILKFDKKGGNPIVGIILRANEEENLKTWGLDGKTCVANPSDDDLRMAPKIKEGWINIYSFPYSSSITSERIYSSEIDAIAGQKGKEAVATISIQWTE